jgi:hypothetical protein
MIPDADNNFNDNLCGSIIPDLSSKTAEQRSGSGATNKFPKYFYAAGYAALEFCTKFGDRIGRPSPKSKNIGKKTRKIG